MTPLPILLVEDDANDVFFFERAVQKAAWQVRMQIVRDGQSAIEYFCGESGFCDRQKFPLPSLTFLDLSLPQKNGLEVLKSIRENATINKTPVIVLTSSNSEQDIREAYNLGANSYLVKPCDAEQLVELLRQIDAYWIRTNRLPPL